MSVTHQGNRFVLENSLISRTIQVDENGLHTVSILHKTSGREYVRRPDVAEFQAALNGQLVESFTKPELHVVDGNMTSAMKHVELESHHISTTDRGGEVLELRLRVLRHEARISVFYEIYPDLPGASKWLEFHCLGEELHISKLFFEALSACAGSFKDATFYRRQGAVPAAAAFACNDEDILQLHNHDLDAGLWFGSGAPGRMRFYMAYPNWPQGVSCGYAMDAPVFNVYLRRGETFTTDKAYLLLYEGSQEEPVSRNQLRELIRRDLPNCVDAGGVMYCTWIPFLKNINEALLLDLADRAAEMGFHTFVVDDGWFAGDDGWRVDEAKFPHGLEVVAQRVHQRGMKFGLWYNIGNDYGAIGSTPETNAIGVCDEPKAFGFSGERTTRCMASGHREFMIAKLSQLAEQYHVDYFKLDFSSISSPYGILPIGCSAKHHEHHRDASDAVFRQYEAMYDMRQEVKKRFPDLVIDFSFETFGTEAPSIAALRYSELHHASNLTTNLPEVVDARKIRNTIYHYCSVLPAERLLCSLICLQNDRDVEHLLTACVGTPLVAGDLRKITAENAAMIKRVTQALNKLIADGPLTEFYKCRGNALIHATDWDGFVRYCVKGDSRGLACLFRNAYEGGAVTLRVPGLPAGANYRFVDCLTDAELGAYSAEALHAGVAVDWLDGFDCRAVAFARMAD